MTYYMLYTLYHDPRITCLLKFDLNLKTMISVEMPFSAEAVGFLVDTNEVLNICTKDRTPTQHCGRRVPTRYAQFFMVVIN
jgi:hypothetical protein